MLSPRVPEPEAQLKLTTPRPSKPPSIQPFVSPAAFNAVSPLLFLFLHTFPPIVPSCPPSAGHLGSYLSSSFTILPSLLLILHLFPLLLQFIPDSRVLAFAASCQSIFNTDSSSPLRLQDSDLSTLLISSLQPGSAVRGDKPHVFTLKPVRQIPTTCGSN